MYVCMYKCIYLARQSPHIASSLSAPMRWDLDIDDEKWEWSGSGNTYIHTYILLCRTAYSKRKHLWNVCMYVYIYMCNKRLFLITVNSDILDHPCNNHSCSTISTYTHTYIHTYSTYSTHTHIRIINALESRRFSYLRSEPNSSCPLPTSTSDPIIGILNWDTYFFSKPWDNFSKFYIHKFIHIYIHTYIQNYTYCTHIHRIWYNVTREYCYIHTVHIHTYCT